MMRSPVTTSLKLIVLCAITLAAIAGCMDNTLDFQIRFDGVHGLKKGDPVVFEASVIGSVTQVAYTDAGDFLAAIAIPQEFAGAVTQASLFYIDAAPHESGQKAVWVAQMETGAPPIEEGAVVDGHAKYAVLYEQFAHQIGKNLSLFEAGIDEFFRVLKGISESEQMQEIEKQLDDIIADLGTMTDEMKHKLENEILPLLREKIEELRKSLEAAGQEDDLDSIDRKMDVIDEELSV